VRVRAAAGDCADGGRGAPARCAQARRRGGGGDGLGRHSPQHHRQPSGGEFYTDNSVADPDPRIFGPPGSGFGSICQRFGSGSGSFYHQAKIVRKTSISTVL
jgi:hypothetical protein